VGKSSSIHTTVSPKDGKKIPPVPRIICVKILHRMGNMPIWNI
jgi:hypothetical protein